MSKITVIHHSADFDGLFCRAIAHKFLPEAELIGWDFKDEPVRVPTEGMIYVMDLPVDKVFGIEFPVKQSNTDYGNQLFSAVKDRLIWIDHHKSSIETHPSDIMGYRIDGVAACRLAWQWFTMVDGNTSFGDVGNSIRSAGVLPMIQDFKHRNVNEPLAVRLAGEYDVWDKRDPRAELFQHGLRSRELDSVTWAYLFGGSTFAEQVVSDLLESGKVVQFVRDNEYREVITQQGFTVQWEGLTFLACNSHELDIRSHLFTAGIKPEHDALLGFTFNGKDWRVSLYGVPGKPDIDLSVIAKRHGGGGHKQACGFICDSPVWTAPASFKDRVVLELNELDAKRRKLHEFINSNDVFKKLPDEEQSRLNRQLEAMTAYADILDQRIDSFP